MVIMIFATFARLKYIARHFPKGIVDVEHVNAERAARTWNADSAGLGWLVWAGQNGLASLSQLAENARWEASLG